MDAVFKQINALPSTQHHPSVLHRNSEVRLGQGGTNVRSHVVGTLRGVPVKMPVSFGNQASHEVVQIGDDIRIGVFLNYQRSRGMAAEYGKQSGGWLLRLQPSLDLPSELIQAFAARAHR